MNEKITSIQNEIKTLHDQSPDKCMRTWFYEGHVALVAKNAGEIAPKVGADAEISILAALFHDIARVWDVNDEPALMNESLAKAEEIMKKHNYSPQQITQVQEAIRNHSCREKLPDTEEGRVLATADALSHIMSDFYFILPFYGWLKAADSFEGYRKWLLEKIERDIHKKIFYPEYKEKVRERYEALKTIFKK